MHDGLPFVYLNVAITADSKLAPVNRQFVPFTSRRDQELLLKLRTRCDAVMAGARTVDSVPVNLGPGSRHYREMRVANGLSPYNLRVVVSGSGTLNPRAEIFRHKFTPLIVLVTSRAPTAKMRRLRSAGAIVRVCGETTIDFRDALRWLRKEWGVDRLLCEGGGEINAGLFRQNLVSQLYLTIAPLIFGGRSAPTAADGEGVAALAEANRLRLKAMERAGDELYLVYTVGRTG
jgi:2,5-diamino-6-(ribosylamino)-4(3H)-pyrimidinone 5'-phosphate reductase